MQTTFTSLEHFLSHTTRLTYRGVFIGENNALYCTYNGYNLRVDIMSSPETYSQYNSTIVQINFQSYLVSFKRVSETHFSWSHVYLESI